MGDGVVVESGKHNELLSNEDGAYARLVAAQRLREGREVIDIDDVVPAGQSSENAVESNVDYEKAALEEVPLGRRDTHKSLASEILEQRNAQGSSKYQKEYSMFYVFKRLGKINKGEWKNYLMGCIFSIGKYFLCSDNPGLLPSVRRDWIRLPGFWYCLVYVQREPFSGVSVELTISCLKQLRLSQAFQTIQLRNAPMLVTATPSGELSPCINTFMIAQLACICRAFIISILAMICIGSQNYLFSASAASLSRKLRSLSLRAILRQDSKSVSICFSPLSSYYTFSVEYFDRDEHSVRAAVFTELYA